MVISNLDHVAVMSEKEMVEGGVNGGWKSVFLDYFSQTARQTNFAIGVALFRSEVDIDQDQEIDQEIDD